MNHEPEKIAEGKNTGEGNSQPEEGKEDPLSKPTRWILGSIIILTGFVFGILIVLWLRSLLSLGIMGISVFFAVLIGSDIFSGTTSLNTGEVRKAITISFVSVYFMMMGILGDINTTSPFLTSLLDNFWWIIAVIIGFYFGGRYAEELTKIVKTRPGVSGKNREPGEPAGPGEQQAKND